MILGNKVIYYLLLIVADLLLSLALWTNLWGIMEALLKATHIGILSKIVHSDYICEGSFLLLIICLFFYLSGREKILLIYIIGTVLLILPLFIGILYLDDCIHISRKLSLWLFGGISEKEYGSALLLGVVWPCASVLSVIISIVFYKITRKNRNLV